LAWLQATARDRDSAIVSKRKPPKNRPDPTYVSFTRGNAIMSGHKYNVVGVVIYFLLMAIMAVVIFKINWEHQVSKAGCVTLPPHIQHLGINKHNEIVFEDGSGVLKVININRVCTKVVDRGD